MQTLYILCGLPFSGKSLLSKEIEKTTSIKRVSFDDMWDVLKQSDKNITYEIALKKIEKKLVCELKNNNSVIYDSVNLSSEHRNKLKKLAEEAGAQAIVVYLKTPVEEIYRRREQSLIDKSHHYLDKKFIDKSNERLEIPTDCITISTEKEKDIFLRSLK